MNIDEKAIKEAVVKAADDYVHAVSIGLGREEIVKRYWYLHHKLIGLWQWKMMPPESVEERIVGAESDPA